MALSREGFLVLVYFFIVRLPLHELWSSHIDTVQDEIISLRDQISGECPAGYYKCDKTPYCILESLRCDGKVDCRDFSDEIYCEKDHSFRIKPKTPWGPCKLTPIRPGCVCVQFNLFCTYQNYTEIPLGLPKPLMMKLDLTGNNFPSLNESFLDYLPETEELILSQCKISFIHRNAFKYFSSIPIEKLSLSYNNIQSFNETIFKKRNRLRHLSVAGNYIKDLHDYDFRNLGRLVELDLTDNLIETINPKVFEPLISLQYLNLSDNHMSRLDSKIFPVLESLDAVYLSGNMIEYIKTSSFRFPRLMLVSYSNILLFELQDFTFCVCESAMRHFLYLYAQRTTFRAPDCVGRMEELLEVGTEFKGLDWIAVEYLSLFQILFLRYSRFCLSPPHVEDCEVGAIAKVLSTPIFRDFYMKITHHCEDVPVYERCELPPISTKTNLLSPFTFEVYAFVLTFTNAVTNLVVFMHLFHQQEHSNAGHTLYQQSLAISGFLMSFYMGIIVIVNFTIHHQYNETDSIWRDTFLCAFAGTVNTCCSLSSVLVLTFGAWDRMKSVIRPQLDNNWMRKTIYIQLAVLWIVSILLASLPLITFEYFGSDYYGHNSFCLPLRIHDPYSQGWEYSTALTVGVNTISLIFIVCCYLRMNYIRETTRRTQAAPVCARAKRFAIILGFNCVFWLPVTFAQAEALRGIVFDDIIYPLLGFGLIPLGAILNPILYAIITMIFSKELERPDEPLVIPLAIIEIPDPFPDVGAIRTTSFIEQPNRSRRARRKHRGQHRQRGRTSRSRS